MIAPSDGLILQRGQRIHLRDITDKAEISVAMGISKVKDAQCRFFCVSCDETGNALDMSDIVFSGRPSNNNASISYAVDSGRAIFNLNISQLDARVRKIILGVGLLDPSFSRLAYISEIREGVMEIIAGGKIMASHHFTGSDFGDEMALALMEIYRKDDWRLCVCPGGFAGGIPAMLSSYKVAGDLVRMVQNGERANEEMSAGPQMPIALPENWPGAIPPSIPKSLLPAVGLMVVNKGGGVAGTGTGFAISPGGLVISCAHVVDKGESISILMGGEKFLRGLTLLGMDPVSDLALLVTNDRNGFERWMMLLEKEHAPSLGEKIGILGYPLGVDLGIEVSYCEGIINSLRKMENSDVLQIDAGAAPGSSGAPVFLRDSGKVVGILSSGLSLKEGGMHINFAVNVNMLWGRNWF